MQLLVKDTKQDINGKNGLSIQKIEKYFTIVYQSTLMRVTIAWMNNLQHVLYSYEKSRILCKNVQINLKLFRITLELRKFFAKKFVSQVSSKLRVFELLLYRIPRHVLIIRQTRRRKSGMWGNRRNVEGTWIKSNRSRSEKNHCWYRSYRWGS